jgi:hypothetical protein
MVEGLWDVADNFSPPKVAFYDVLLAFALAQ